MRKSNLSLIFPFFGMFLLILDTKTALMGALDGISLCLQTVIPSLFPFLVLSSMLTYGLSGRALALLSPVERLLRIPPGSGSYWLVGLLGGYPVGARALWEARENGSLANSDYRRMMAFCSNAGPAFLFGIGSHLFSDVRWCWYLWLIHIAASVLMAVLTPGGEQGAVTPPAERRPSLTQSMEEAVRTMGLVCGWVVLFRVLIAFCQRWFLWALPRWVQMLLLGMLELANGCTALYALPEEALRFVFFSLFLGFGGLCVSMQTKSICREPGMYLPGKLMHGLLSALMAGMVISREIRLQLGFCLVLLCGVYYFLCGLAQKRLDFRAGMRYDRKKSMRGNMPCSFARKSSPNVPTVPTAPN